MIFNIQHVQGDGNQVSGRDAKAEQITSGASQAARASGAGAAATGDTRPKRNVLAGLFAVLLVVAATGVLLIGGPGMAYISMYLVAAGTLAITGFNWARGR